MAFRELVISSALLACGGSKSDPPALPADTAVTSAIEQLHCAAPGTLPRSNRTETCRVLADFAAGGAFTQLPTKAEELWFGLAYSAAPGTEIEEAAERSFFVLYLRPGAAPASLADTQHVPASALVPAVAENLVMTAFKNPTGTDARAAQERADFARFSALVDQHGAGVAPELVDELRKKQDYAGLVRGGPVAVWRTAGTSLVLRGPLPGGKPTMEWYLRMAADGHRALLAEGTMVAELYRLP